MLRPGWRDVLRDVLKKPENGYGMPISNEGRTTMRRPGYRAN
jgi:hypothetical protein